MSTSSNYAAAEERAERGFLTHAGVFLIVNGGLAALNLARNPANPWFLWVLGGWGLGLLLHATAVHLSPEMRERTVQRIAARMERRAERLDRSEQRRQRRMERREVS